MPRIIILLFLLFAAWYVWRYIVGLPPHQRVKIMRSWGLIALIAVSLLLVATGKMHWVGAALAAAIPIIRVLAGTLVKAFPLLQFWHRYQGKPSVIKTRGLEVTIDFSSGETSGTVFDGPHQGANLDALDESQLKEQLAYFQEKDRQSALLLQAYLMRRGFSAFKAGAQSRSQPISNDAMGQDEALQILGLDANASKDEIIQAHRRLIQKLHPDRGGNDYLAAKINLAKDVLLEKSR